MVSTDGDTIVSSLIGFKRDALWSTLACDVDKLARRSPVTPAFPHGQ